MSIKEVVAQQRRDLVNRSMRDAQDITVPKEGWLKIVRQSLGMKVPQLAKRLGVSRTLIYSQEKAEQSGGITLNKMSNIAEAMDCKFVYAIIPEYAGKTIEDYIDYKARQMAISIINKTNTNMALEAQDLPAEKREREVVRVTQEILSKDPASIWDK